MYETSPSFIVAIELSARTSAEVNIEPAAANAVHVTVAVPNVPSLNIFSVTVTNPDSGSCTVSVNESEV